MTEYAKTLGGDSGNIVHSRSCRISSINCTQGYFPQASTPPMPFSFPAGGAAKGWMCCSMSRGIDCLSETWPYLQNLASEFLGRHCASRVTQLRKSAATGIDPLLEVAAPVLRKGHAFMHVFRDVARPARKVGKADQWA